MSEIKEKSAVGTAIPATEQKTHNTDSIADGSEKIKYSIEDLKIFFFKYFSKISCQQDEDAVGRAVFDVACFIEELEKHSEDFEKWK